MPSPRRPSRCSPWVAWTPCSVPVRSSAGPARGRGRHRRRHHRRHGARGRSGDGRCRQGRRLYRRVRQHAGGHLRGSRRRVDFGTCLKIYQPSLNAKGGGSIGSAALFVRQSMMLNGCDARSYADERRDQDKRAGAQAHVKPAPKPRDPYIRAENEDDDGYDPYSDRRPEREPMFEADPWR